MSHTPGPWIVETPRDRHAEDSGYDGDWSEKYPCHIAIRSHWDPPINGVVGYQLCKMSGVGDHTLANARLIAAAPELLESLEALLNFAWGEGYSDVDPELARAEALVAALRESK